MQQIRETSSACYDNFSDEQKHKAYAVFEAMDSDGNHTVSLKECEEFLGALRGSPSRSWTQTETGSWILRNL
ncbi:hypothetical protein TB2_008420 [Malus domestica]